MKNEVPVRAVSRFITLLREINSRGPLTLAELVKATGINYSTSLRIVHTMLAHNLIERVPQTKLYAVTAMALSLSHGFQSPQKLASAAQPLMDTLTRRIGWPVVIMTRSGASMVARASTHHLTTLAFGPCPPGSSEPVLHSAAGHAFLAYASRQERAGVLDGIRQLEPAAPILSALVEGELLDRVRHDGFATYERSRHTSHPGKTSAISVPVHHAGEVQGVLTAVFFSSAMPLNEALRRYQKILKGSAASIETALSTSAPTIAEAELPSQTTKRIAVLMPKRAPAFVPAFASEHPSERCSAMSRQ